MIFPTSQDDNVLAKRILEVKSLNFNFDEYCENIRSLTDSLSIIKDGNLSFRDLALDLAANSILLAQIDQSVNLKSEKAKRELEVRQVQWLQETPRSAASPANTIRFTSLYNWLKNHFPLFWLKAFGEPISDDHFKKLVSDNWGECDKFSAQWEQHGIPFYHGFAIFLLTTTSIFGETKKQFACMWVINSYPRFAPYMAAAPSSLVHSQPHSAEVSE